MTTVSPTPFAAVSFGNGRSSHQTAARSYPRRDIVRPPFRRQSPLSVPGHGHGFSADAPMLQRISVGDSSDDEIPQPLNFSALTRALLADKPSTRPRSPPPENHAPQQHYESGRSDGHWSKSRSGTPSRGALRVTRRSPAPAESEGRDTQPKVVQISSSDRLSALRRSLSPARSDPPRSVDIGKAREELATPAPTSRERPFTNRTDPGAISDGHQNLSNSVEPHSSANIRHEQVHQYNLAQDYSVEREPHSAHHSSSGTSSDPATEPGSLKVKLPLTSGTVRRSGVRGAPMRRPLHRRLSDADQSPANEEHSASRRVVNSAHQESQHPDVQGGSLSLMSVQAPISVHDFAEDQQRQTSAQNLPIVEPNRFNALKESRTALSNETESPSSHAHSSGNLKLRDKAISQATQNQHVFKMPALPPALPSLHDQENEPPPTFKRNKPQGSGVLGQVEKITILAEAKPSRMLIDTPRAKSPPRQALIPRDINTPQRKAPPPPKMTVLETATATGGASTVRSKTKRSHITVNGKIFTLQGRVGKGGSSHVYRVMAENDKMFALKKVNLKDCNEDTVRGYKGEIELLKALKDVDRVIRLFDWEVNEPKQSLSVLMEIGESDLSTVLGTRLHPENATLDLSFTRHYWREMLCCVEAVHAYDIVHSDLKPANFLLVQGRLKLIDFGIANAIDVDNTVNVHRETNVGTPNYMSPESLQDTNADQRSAVGSGTMSKLMKLGKPSDVWSLGCILYQMTYGKPPFAHIVNQWNRVMAIINPAVVITYPETGIGGVTVPNCLQGLLRSCLNRDASQRPTVTQLLGDREAFLNPDRAVERWEKEGAVPVTEHVLEQILMRIVERCRDPKRGVPTDEEVKVYPRAFLDRVKEMQRA